MPVGHDAERVVDLRQVAGLELDVDDRADDLDDLADVCSLRHVLSLMTFCSSLTSAYSLRPLQRLRARHHFDDLARDRRLADLVHVERQARRSCRPSSCVAVSIAVICAAKNAAFDSSSAR